MDIPPTIKSTKQEILTYYEKYKNISAPDQPPRDDNVEVSVPPVDTLKNVVLDETEVFTPFKESDMKETGITEIKANVGEEIEAKEVKKMPIKAKRNPPEDGYSCYEIITAHLKVSKDPFDFLYMKVEDRTTMQEDMKKWHASRYAHIPLEQRPTLKYGKLDYKTFFRDVLSQHEGKLTTLKDMYDRFHM